MNDHLPALAPGLAPMMEELHARAGVTAAITLSDGTHVDVEGVARRAYIDRNDNGHVTLLIPVEGEDEVAETRDLDHDDHGYIEVPIEHFANVEVRCGAAGRTIWSVKYERGGARVHLVITEAKQS